AHARIALGIGFTTGGRAGESLLAVETIAGGEDHRPRAILRHRSPKRLLNRFRAGSGPDDFLKAAAAAALAAEVDEVRCRLGFDRCDGVVSCQRHSFLKCLATRLIPAHGTRESLHPGGGLMAE